MTRPFRILAALLCMASPVMAVEGDHDRSGQSFGFGDFELTLGLEAGFGLFSVGDAQNGAGSASSGGRRTDSRSWAEGFVAPGLTLDYHLDDTTFYSGVKLVGSATRGSGEARAVSTTGTRPEALELDDYYLGWKSGLAFASLGEDAIDISAGRQGFMIGDGFIIADGTLDDRRRAAYVLGPRPGFDRTVIARINTMPVRADLFHLASVTDQHLMRGQDDAATSLYGANIEWFDSSHRDHGRTAYQERAWYLGLMALKLYDVDSAISPARDGMTVAGIRSGGALFSGLGEGWQDFALYSEYARQGNNATGIRTRAEAWHIEPQYTFSILPWSPRISYRYARFSGDNNAADNRNSAWDPLYTAGGPRGYGSWDLGEIYERYTGSNSNLISQMLQLKLQPAGELAFGAVYYRHDYDRRITASDRLSDEINLFATWLTPLSGLTVDTVLGAAKAGEGRRQQNGGANDTTWLGQMVFSYQF